MTCYTQPSIPPKVPGSTAGIEVETPFTDGYICFVLPESIIDARGYLAFSATKSSKIWTHAQLYPTMNIFWSETMLPSAL
jgi:hypothetical protein